MRHSTLLICLGSLLLTSCITDPNAYKASGSSRIQGATRNASFFSLHGASTSVSAIDKHFIFPTWTSTNVTPINISSGKHLISTTASFADGFGGDGYEAQEDIPLNVKPYENYTVNASHTQQHMQTWIVDRKGNIVTKKVTSIAMPLNGTKEYVAPLPKN